MSLAVMKDDCLQNKKSKKKLNETVIIDKSKKKGYKRSLHCPQSVDNLNTLHIEVSEFEMTQSLYEVTGQKEQIEKMSQQSKLMKLIASEKAANTMQKKRLKEMKAKMTEQKKRNDEKQKIVEERRIKITENDEEKRKKISNKMNKSNIAKSDLINKFNSAKTLVSSNHNFLESRPHSSTGNIFGFGSSTPRFMYESIKADKVIPNNHSYSRIIKTNRVPISKLRSNETMKKDSSNDNKVQSVKKSCEMSSITNQFNKIQKNTPKSIKKQHNVNVTEVIHKKSSEKIEPTFKTTIKATISTTVATKESVTKSSEFNSKGIIKDINHSSPVKSSEINSQNKKTSLMNNKKNISSNNNLVNPEKYNQNSGKIEEIRFVTGNEFFAKNENSGLKHVIKDISNDAYNLQTNLEMKVTKENTIERNNKKDEVITNYPEGDISVTNFDKNKQCDLKKDIPVKEGTEIFIIKPIEEKESFEELLKKRKINERNDGDLTDIEDDKEIAMSTDEIDRLERKEKLKLIMSRVKKHTDGSIDNFNHCMTPSALQNMMEKGHLTGMSKTAAVLMKNSNRLSDFNFEGSKESARASISMENISNVIRGDCDGKEDSSKETNKKLEIKSNLMQNLTSTPEGSIMLSWKEKYSLSDSLDSETDISEGI